MVYKRLTLGGLQKRWVTVCAAHIFILRALSHHASAALDEPVSNFTLCWHHLSRCASNLSGRLLTLTERKLGHMVLDFHFTWRAFIKFDGKGCMALNHRGCGGGGDAVRGICCVFCWNFMNLRLWFLGRTLLELLCWDLKVTGLPAVGEDGLSLTVWQRAIALICGHIFSRFCCQ